MKTSVGAMTVTELRQLLRGVPGGYTVQVSASLLGSELREMLKANNMPDGWQYCVEVVDESKSVMIWTEYS